MERIDDERVAFYLRYREDIEKWAALREESSRMLHRFLKESVSDIQGLESELRGAILDPKPRITLKKGAIRFHRESWKAGNGKIRVNIGLVWNGEKAVFYPAHRREPPWVTLSVPADKELRSSLKSNLAETAKSKGWKPGRVNVFWRYVTPQIGDEYWTDLGPYRKRIMAAVRDLWNEMADTVDEVVAESRAQPS